MRRQVFELSVAFLEGSHATCKLSFQNYCKPGMYHTSSRFGDKDNGDRLRSVIACPGSNQGQVLAIEFRECMSFDLMAA